MTSLHRSVYLIGLAAGLLLATSGCDPYTYFNVNVSLDSSVSAQDRFNVASCTVFVLEGGKKIENGQPLKTIAGPLACQPGTLSENPNIGVMDYSTARSSGTLQFFVSMLDTDPKPILEGSANMGVSPGHILSVDLVCKNCSGPCTDTSKF